VKSDSDKFVVNQKAIHLSMKQIRVSNLKVFIDRCQNSTPTCPPVEKQPQASCATGSYDVRRIPRMHKIIVVREGILLQGWKNLT